MKTTLLKTLLLLPLFILLIVPPTSADLLVQLESVTPDTLNFPGYYRWSYSLTVGNEDGCNNDGSCFFTIYDFGTPYTISGVSSWRSSSALVGATPTGLTPTDDPMVANITFRFGVGSVPPFSPEPFAGTGQIITGFDVISSLSNIAFGQYSWQDQDRYPIDSITMNQRGLEVVGVPSTTSSPVPEPGILILLGISMASIVGLRRWWKE